MIIVDDGSKDNSVELISEYCKNDSRIKLYTHPNNENKGLRETIKLGIKFSNCDWIIFLECFFECKKTETRERVTPLNDYKNKKYGQEQ